MGIPCVHQFKAARSARTKRIEFDILSPDEIRRLAVCEIKNPLLYARGMPMREGALDFRMGTCDRRLRCGTCGGDVLECPGHCGFIDLGVPMYHTYIETALKALRSVCYFCSTLLGGGDDFSHLEGKQRFLAVYNVARTRKQCPSCQACQPRYTRTPLAIRLDWPTTTVWESDEERDEVLARTFTSIEAASILRHISDSDVRSMGFDPQRSHPGWMVPDVLLVPPPACRPPIMSSSGSRLKGQDDLTIKLNDINKRAIDIRALLAATRANGWDLALSQPGTELVIKMQRLQAEIFAFLHGTPPSTGARGGGGRTPRSSAPIRSLAHRLRGKEGRIRGNLMGKRVDFSARSVITPDPFLAVDELGMPIEVAHELTVRERVGAHNIARLRRRVLVGADDVAGARSVLSESGESTQLQFLDDDARAQIRLQFGQIVERYIETGDHVIFNRQPSLHRIGFLGHRVRLFPGKTFRLNLSVTSPYNADFDGDEMNCHVCQNDLARAEVEMLMAVRLQVITPQSARPVMGIVQDTLVGTYLLTRQSTLLTRAELMRLATWVGDTGRRRATVLPPPALRIGTRSYWTGAQAFSLLLPPELTIDRLSRAAGGAPLWPAEGVVVRDGRLYCGRLGKPMLGTGSGGIVDTLYRQLGSTCTVAYMANLQRLVTTWLLGQGFSVSFRDASVSAEGRARVAEHIAATRATVEAVVQTDFPPTLQPMAEASVFSMLSKLLLQTGAIGRRHMRRRSSIATLVDSGSKGNQLNTSQVTSLVGQQSIEGKRVFSESTSRTLSCFEPHDTSLMGHGFVESSYTTGLSPAEFFFHCMGGREGLIDTAVKTAHTGYLQRRMVKALEDMVATYDATRSVRNAQGLCVQPVYGLDGWDPTQVQQATLSALTESEAQLRRGVCDDAAPTEVQERELGRLLEAVRAARCSRASPLLPSMHARTLLPFSPQQLLSQVRDDDDAEQEDRAAFEAEVERCSEAFCRRMADEPVPRTNVVVAARYHFCSRRLRAIGCRRASVARLFATVLDRCLESWVVPGEALGSIAAQSLGEPTTQMTLNTFHHSGIASKNVTLGVPRLKELLDASRHPRTPMITMRLRAPHCYDAALAARFARGLSAVRLAGLVRSMDVVDEPDLERTSIEADRTIVTIDALLRPPPPGASRHVARLLLDKPAMRQRDLTPPHLQQLLEAHAGLGGGVHVVASEVNSLEWVLRVRFLSDAAALREWVGGAPGSDLTLARRATTVLLERVHVGGHAGIATASEREIDAWNPTTERNERVFVVDAYGAGVLDSCALFPEVDELRSVANNPHEVAAALGIEAALATIHHEVDTVVSFDSTNVEKRHILLLADSMCVRGRILAMSRHGLNRPETGTGPLARASFEETVDTLIDAATYAETEPAQGVSQAVMLGEASRTIGTGCFDVLAPEDYVSGHVREAPRARRLVKSAVRPAAARAETASVGYVDRSVWCFDSTAPREAMSRPFVDEAAAEPDRPLATGPDRPLAYDGPAAQRPGAREAPAVYVPSSPRVVECKKRRA